MTDSLHLVLAYMAETLSLETWRVPLTVSYILLLLLIGVYGVHRYWLVFTYNKHRRNIPRPRNRFETLPRVTVQLPMFNEGSVAERIIDAACELDYPRELLQVQVVDDSTDHTKDLSQRRVELWKSRGIDIEFIHRTDRTGFKAGALANALKSATGADVVYVYIFGDGVPHLHVHLAPHRDGDALNDQMIRGQIVEEKMPNGMTHFYSSEFPPLPRGALEEVANRVKLRLNG